MNNFLIDDYNINENYAIEASAGTGKTYNVVKMVEKMLNSGVSLNEILIVTYTEKACGELKDRIKQIKTNNNSSVDINSSNIYTIHSFCLNTIKEFGISAKLPLSMEMLEDEDLDKFTNIYIQNNVLNDISYLKEIDINLDLDKIKKLLIDSCKKYYLNDEGKEDKSIISLAKSSEDLSLKSNFLFLEKENLDIFKIVEIFHKIKTCDSIDDFYSLLPHLEENIEFFNNNPNENKNALQNFYDDFCNIETINKGFNFNGHKTTSKEFKEFKQSEEFLYLKSLKDFFSKDSLSFVGYTYIFYKHVKNFYIEFLKYKSVNKEESFNDMIRFVREALKEEVFINKLKNKYKYGIIDEFQDTNQIQFDIFKTIFLTDNDHHIVVVGDPKQSIYSFQGADVNVYKEAVKEIESKGGNLRALNKNYRSSENVVTICNEMFLNFGFSNPSFTPSRFKNKADKDTKIYETKYLDNVAKSLYVIGKDEAEFNEYDFAHSVCEQIIDFTTKENDKTKLQILVDGVSRDVTFKDFTVLCQKKSEMEPIKDALKKAGIPYIQYKNDSLFKGHEVKNVIAILEALTIEDFTNNNRKYFYKVLKTVFFGYTLKEISDERFEYDNCCEMVLLQNWRDLIGNTTYEALFDEIINESKLYDNLKGHKNIETISIYKQIFSYSLSYLLENNNLSDLIIKLKKLSDNIDEDEEGKLVAKSSDFDAVQIMTMHASKGLQFPIVICASKGKEKRDLGYVHLIHGCSTKLVCNQNEIVKTDVREEYKRLFYVAYTRAMNMLILPYFSKTDDNQFDGMIKGVLDKVIENNNDLVNVINYQKTPFEILLKKSSEIIKSKNTSVRNSSNDMNNALSLNKELIKKSFKKSTYKHSYTSLSHPKKEIDESNLEGEELTGLDFDYNAVIIEQQYELSKEKSKEYFSHFPKGSTMGTLIHEIFERLNFKNYNNSLEDLVKKTYNSYGFELIKENIDKTCDIVRNTMEASINFIGENNEIKQIKLSQIDECDKLTEAEFNFNLDKEELRNYCNGFIDLLFRVQGKYAIIDWKSDNLNEGFDSYASKEGIKYQVDDRYSIQRVLYAYCLINWLSTKYLSLSKSEIFDKYFGGIYYVFVKGTVNNTGNGIYGQTWESYQRLEDEYNDIINKCVEDRNA